MTAGGVPTTRFGQLTYTSFDPGIGRSGGWQVKDVRNLEPDEVAALSERVATQLDLGRELPPFPTPEEVAALPRRLAHAAILGGVASWHTAPAGIDASGRTGNVFAQVVLDRDPDAIDPVRPIDRWRSPGWLTPFNHDEVLAAVLSPIGPAAPDPGTRVGAEAVIDFLLDVDAWRRPNLLAVLVDAVAAAVRGGPTVVLGCADVDTAALWVGGVSHLMSARHARRLSFSTFERSATLGFAASSRLHLVCVPQDDLEALLPREGQLLLDERETVGMGEPGSAPHTTDRGATIAASPFSVLALEALRDRTTALQVLAEIDRLEPFAGADLPAAWPIAMAMLRDQTAFEEVRPLAESVVAVAELPDGAPDDLVAVVASARDHLLGTTTADAWSALSALEASSAPGRPGLAPEHVARTYIRRALEDTVWLAQPGGPPMPAEVPLLSPDYPWLDSVLTGLESFRWHNQVAGALVQLRAIDLLVRTGGLPTQAPLGRAQALLRGAGSAAAVLLDPSSAPALLEDLERLAEPTIDAYVRPAVVEALDSLVGITSTPLGARVPPGVIGALRSGGRLPVGGGIAEAVAWAVEADVLDREAVQVDANRARAAGVADRHPLATLAAQCADAQAFGVVDATTDHGPLDEWVVLSLVRAFGTKAVPATVAVRALAELPDSPALREVWLGYLDHPTVGAWAQMRDAASPARWYEGLRRNEPVADVLSRAARRVLLEPTRLHPEVTAMLQSAWLLCHLGDDSGAARDDVPLWVLEIVLDGDPAILAREWLTRALPGRLVLWGVWALVRDERSSPDPGADARTVRSTIGGATAPLLELAMRHALTDPQGPDPASVVLEMGRSPAVDDAALSRAEQILHALAPRGSRLNSAIDRLRRR